MQAPQYEFNIRDNTEREIGKFLPHLYRNFTKSFREEFSSMMKNCVKYDLREDRVQVTFNEEKAFEYLNKLRNKYNLPIKDYLVNYAREFTIYPVIMMEKGYLKNRQSSTEPSMLTLYSAVLALNSGVTLDNIRFEVGETFVDIPATQVPLEFDYVRKMERTIIAIEIFEDETVKQYVTDNHVTYFL